jgi:hypothetical protein
MPEKIISMHAAHKSGKEMIDGFLSRRTITWLRRTLVQ